MLPIRVWMDLESMVIEEYTAFLKALLEPGDQIV